MNRPVRVEPRDTGCAGEGGLHAVLPTTREGLDTGTRPERLTRIGAKSGHCGGVFAREERAGGIVDLASRAR
jgi:hypothetical protein